MQSIKIVKFTFWVTLTKGLLNREAGRINKTIQNVSINRFDLSKISVERDIVIERS